MNKIIKDGIEHEIENSTFVECSSNKCYATAQSVFRQYKRSGVLDTFGMWLAQYAECERLNAKLDCESGEM